MNTNYKKTDPNWKRNLRPALPQYHFLGADVDDLEDADDESDKGDFRKPGERRPLSWGILSGGFGFPWSCPELAGNGSCWRFLRRSHFSPRASLIPSPEIIPLCLITLVLGFVLGLPFLVIIVAVISVKCLTILTATAGGSREIVKTGRQYPECLSQLPRSCLYGLLRWVQCCDRWLGSKPPFRIAKQPM